MIRDAYPDIFSICGTGDMRVDEFVFVVALVQELPLYVG